MTRQSISLQHSPVRGLADIPSDGVAECCVAHLMMALISCHLRMAEKNKLHIAKALAILEAQPHLPQTIRVTHDITVVRIVSQAEDVTVTLRLPMINHSVIVPVADLQSVLRATRRGSSCSTMISIAGIEIDHVRLRLRTARLKMALAVLQNMSSLDEQSDNITTILEQCIFPALKPVAPLDTADALFAVARSFTRLGNQALSQLALQKAKSCIQLYAEGTHDNAHAYAMARKISGLVDQVGAALS